MLEKTYESFYMILIQTLSEFSAYIPRLIAALTIFIIGSALANALKKVVVKGLDALKLSKSLQKTPIEHFLKDAEITKRIELVIGTLVYWLIMLVVLQSSIGILGLTSISDILRKILNFIPDIAVAILILFFGVLLSGLVESLVKGSLKTLDQKTGRALGKISSYLVMTISVLMAVSELGIASEFILILFVGFVGAVSLGLGLALGLGGQDLVKKLLDKYYKNNLK